MTFLSHTTHQEKANKELTIEFLVREYFSYIHRLSFSILDDNSEADDAAQETFIHAHQALSGYRAEAELKTWLSAIAINTCRGKLRKRKTRQVLSSMLQVLHLQRLPSTTPEERILQSEIDRSIWAAVDNLDDKHRIPVILRYVHEFNVPEIARILHLNQGTVHSRLHYARQTLHVQLGHLNPRKEVPDESSE